ncbi:MAG: clostripain-related cysteine peptidase [Oscillospiraceae bacterium]
MKSNRILAALCAACMLALSGCGSIKNEISDILKSEAESNSSADARTDDASFPEDSGNNGDSGDNGNSGNNGDSGDNGNNGNNGDSSNNGDSGSSAVRTEVGLSMALDDGGRLAVDRKTVGSVPMGEDGTWTIFVYMCGTDLESDGGSATDDVLEMMEATTGENVCFVVQTGGTACWQNDLMPDDKTGRYCIYNGDIYSFEEQPAAPMGSSNTLADFLTWGVENCPAAKMGLVFWNHGGGSISGVCFDELNGGDSLSLMEIYDGLKKASAAMTDRFEFIGFDACLMGTIESANILATYARYMYASQEVEPGSGWDYASIGSYLGDNPYADGAQLGKAVCDSYYRGCEYYGDESFATLSVVDLSKIDDVIISFNDFARELYSASENNSVLSAVVRNACCADNFGGNNKAEGYTNMVDLAGIVRAGADHSSSADSVLKALDSAVIYKRSGSDHSTACGLSMYYPLELQGSEELKIFGGIAISPYYLSFVDRTVYGNSNSGSVSGYDNSSVIDIWEGEEDDSYWDSYGECEATGNSPLIVYYDEPQFLSDGTYGFSLTDESLWYTASVEANVFMMTDDMENLIELGVSADIYADWSTGVFMDNFDGCWFALPDGQILAIYIVAECDGYDVYTSPIMLNGELTNLRITHDYINGNVTIDGAWDGIDENGMASRDIRELKQGDVIIPVYYYMAVYSDDEGYWYGGEYVVNNEQPIEFEMLPDGEYLYNFTINDIYGDFRMTDFVNFTVDGYDIYFSEIN